MSQYDSGMELTDSAAPPAAPAADQNPPAPAADPAPSPVDTPAADPKPDAPADSPPADAPPVDPAPPTEELFDLPDGRKVNAAGLKAEYENLLPEFTRRSQRLAELERGGDPKDIKKPDENVPEWKKPDYEPKSYAEIVEIAKQEALNEIRTTAQAEEQRVTAIRTAVDGQLAEIRKTDPKLDENALFIHANKYGFTDLKAAHANMQDLKKVAVETEQRVLKNIKTREADPVSGGGGNPPADDGAYDPSSMSQYASAADYLARIKGKQ